MPHTNPVWLSREGDIVRVQPTMSSPPGVCITSFAELLAFIDQMPELVIPPPAPPRKKVMSLDDIDFSL